MLIFRGVTVEISQSFHLSFHFAPRPKVSVLPLAMHEHFRWGDPAAEWWPDTEESVGGFFFTQKKASTTCVFLFFSTHTPKKKGKLEDVEFIFWNKTKESNNDDLYLFLLKLSLFWHPALTYHWEKWILPAEIYCIPAHEACQTATTWLTSRVQVTMVIVVVPVNIGLGFGGPPRNHEFLGCSIHEFFWVGLLWQRLVCSLRIHGKKMVDAVLISVGSTISSC